MNRPTACNVRAAIHIARPIGLDPATTPVLDARLGDGSRVAICVPPASPHVAITVRRFGNRSFSAALLVEQGAMPEHIRHAAERTLHTRRNILVAAASTRPLRDGYTLICKEHPSLACATSSTTAAESWSRRRSTPPA